MTETNQKLRELLQQLHDELKQLESVDDDGREMLSHLNADIQQFLDPTRENPESFLEQLQSAIDHFEVEHPAITAALSQMLNALSNAGI
jgi:flagellar biosynthesis chaperone FliJ